MAKTAERSAEAAARQNGTAHLGAVGESEGGGLGLLSESSVARGAARPAEIVNPQLVQSLIVQIDTLAGFGIPREAFLGGLTPEVRKAVEAKLAFRDHERQVALR